MRIGLDDFTEQNYIGDWVVDSSVRVDLDTIKKELGIISSVPEEFSFHVYDAMVQAELWGVKKEDIEHITSTSFRVGRLERELEESRKRLRK